MKSQSPTKIARALGIPVATVSAWMHRGRIPAERVIEVERVTGISRHQLRPDLYPKEAENFEQEAA